MKLIRNKYISFLLLLYIIFFFSTLLLSNNNINGDFNFHYSRIKYLAENINNDCFFSPIYYPQIEAYGYGSPMFYCNLFLYPFACLMLIGVSDNVVTKLAIITPILISLITSYYSIYKIFKNHKSAFIFCIVYNFSTYYFCNVFSRYALGEAYATSFLPLVMLGFYSITFEDSKHWLALPIGLACCMLSHILTSLITVITLFIVFILFISIYIKDKKKIGKLFSSATIFLLLTAFLFSLCLSNFYQ